MIEFNHFIVPTDNPEIEVPVRLLRTYHAPLVADSPLILVHDGSDYDRRGHITGFIDDATREYDVAPVVALVDPDTKNNIMRLKQYGASNRYRDFLKDVLIPKIQSESNTHGPLLGIGGSMGGLALLHAADAFDTLFLQSASFHHPDYDDQDYDEFGAVSRFVAEAREHLPVDRSLPITMTCGDELNLQGNHDMFYALRSQGHHMMGGKVDHGHGYENWAHVFEPHLRDALACVYSLRHSLTAA